MKPGCLACGELQNEIKAIAKRASYAQWAGRRPDSEDLARVRDLRQQQRECEARDHLTDYVRRGAARRHLSKP